MKTRLFPQDLPHRQWVKFPAAGFAEHVSGVIYGLDAPAINGMPLGGIDTGCIDLEVTGNLGLMSIFNSLAPRRGPLERPFVGVRLDDEVHVLAAHGMRGPKAPRNIEYWGHYPVADIEYELDAPMTVGVRAWSPFAPGDIDASMIPAAVFEVHLRNASRKPLRGSLAISFPGYAPYEAPFQIPHLRKVQGALSGYLSAIGGHTEPFTDERAMAYLLAVIGRRVVRIGPDFGNDPVRWMQLGTDAVLPPHAIGYDNSGISISTDFQLAPSQCEVTRFVLAWYAPRWSANGLPSAGGNQFLHMYATRFANVEAVANYVAEHHESLLRRVLNWQQVIYSEPKLLPWLRDGLVNILHLITETGVWAQAKEPLGTWCKAEDGLFGLNECPRSCPQIECLPCSVYGNLPLVYFFPQLALSTLRGYKRYQFENGQPPWIFGGITGKQYPGGAYDMASPDRGYQETLNGYCVVELVDKLWLRTKDDQIVREFYDMCKRATDWTMTFRPEYGDSQVVAMPSGDKAKEWFEAPEPGWRGYANHVGAIRLHQVLMMKRMAEAFGDEQYAAQCQRWFEAGAAAMEQYLWSGTYYLNFNKPETGERSDWVFGNQLDGQWFTKLHGTPDVLPADRVRIALETIERCNIALSKHGAVNYAMPDGRPAEVGGWGTYGYMASEVLMLAMTYVYGGKLETGMKLAERFWRNVICDQRLMWDQPNLFRGDVNNGEAVFGHDYSQNMVLWSFPAALAGQSLDGPCEAGGLVDRVLKAANS